LRTESRAGLVGLVFTCFLPFASGYFFSYFYRSVNAVIGPVLVSELGLDAAALGLLTSAYFIAFAALAPRELGRVWAWTRGKA